MVDLKDLLYISDTIFRAVKSNYLQNNQADLGAIFLTDRNFHPAPDRYFYLAKKASKGAEGPMSQINLVISCQTKIKIHPTDTDTRYSYRYGWLIPMLPPAFF